MKAVQLSRFGDPEVLEITDIPTPVPGKGEVLVRMRAAGINFFETLLRRDLYAFTPPLPYVLGVEVAGVVEALGDGVEKHKIGTRVAVPLFATAANYGGYAEFAVIDANMAVPLPDDLSFEAAAALMVQGLTALYLTKLVSPQGKSVLVNAAAGGVGSILVQLARHAGAARVLAAASTEAKLDFARSFGADTGVDYTRASWVEEVQAATGGAGVDIIYESVGGDVTLACLDALAPLGHMVIYGALNIQGFDFGVPELKTIIFKNLSVTGFSLLSFLTPEQLRAGLVELFDLTVAGKLQVSTGGSYPLAHAAEAHRALESRGTIGKLVLVS